MTMCDNETRALFKKQRKLEFLNTGLGMLMLAMLMWGSFQLFEQGKSQEAYKAKLNSHILEYADLATKIPDGFFTKSRYGEEDARHDREINAQARQGLDDRIHALERLSSSHIQEAEIWKQTIRDTVTSVRSLEQLVWKTSREQIDR